jgi:hypothetical protein
MDIIDKGHLIRQLLLVVLVCASENTGFLSIKAKWFYIEK